jgi:hypothetical protein
MGYDLLQLRPNRTNVENNSSFLIMKILLSPGSDGQLAQKIAILVLLWESSTGQTHFRLVPLIFKAMAEIQPIWLNAGCPTVNKAEANRN